MYAKLFTSIYQGTLRGNSHGLLVFTNLLAHADQLGRVDVHPRAIAEEVGLTVEQVRAALDMLEAPDDESRSPECQGRRIVRMDEHRAWGWTVVNYLKYRAIRNEEDRREQNRESQRRYREKHKPASADISQDKPQSAPSETDKPIQRQKQKQKEDTKESTSRAVDARASRLPADWTPPTEWIEFVMRERPDLDALVTAAKFKDYWIAKPGKAGTKLDWAATWRNWVREERGRPTNGLKPSKPAWLADREARMAEFTGKSKEIIDAATRRLD